MAVQILREQGIEWDGRPKGMEEVVDQTWELIIILCDRAKEVCPSFPGQAVLAHRRESGSHDTHHKRT